MNRNKILLLIILKVHYLFTTPINITFSILKQHFAKAHYIMHGNVCTVFLKNWRRTGDIQKLYRRKMEVSILVNLFIDVQTIFRLASY
jgi:hypothetical protein